jgi:outer membrane protein assembly factor BamB
LGLALGAPASGQGSGEDWPTYRGDAANTGWRSGTAGVATVVEERWSAEPALDVNYLSVRGGTVYLSTDNGQSDPYEGAVRALDAGTGEGQWTFETDRWMQSMPVATTDAVYVLSNGAGEGRVFRLDRSDGSREWSEGLGSESVVSLTVVDGTVYVGEIDGTVVAMAAGDGARQWERTLGNRIWYPPAVVDGTVYVTGDNGGVGTDGPSTVHALDATTGEERWRYDLGPLRATCTPAVSVGTAYVVDYDGTLHALATADGSQRFTFDGGEGTSTPPAVHDGTVYLGGTEGLYALHGETGDVEWELATEDRVDQPVGTTDALYATLDGALTAVDPSTGDTRALAQMEGRPVAVAGDSVYVTAGESVRAFTITERVAGLPVPAATPSPTPSPTGTPTATPSPTVSPTRTATSEDIDTSTERIDLTVGGDGDSGAHGTTTGDGSLSLATAVGSVLGAGALRAGWDRYRDGDEE